MYNTHSLHDILEMILLVQITLKVADFWPF